MVKLHRSTHTAVGAGRSDPTQHATRIAAKLSASHTPTASQCGRSEKGTKGHAAATG